METNNLKFAIRSLFKDRVYNLINIIGLSLGIATAFVIFIWINFENSFDQFWEGKDRIYRVVTNTRFGDSNFRNPGVPGPIGEEIRSSFTGIEHSVRFWVSNEHRVLPGGEQAEKRVLDAQNRIIFTEESYFDVFEYPWLVGQKRGSLDQPNRVVLTQRRAEQYFPNINLSEVVGQVLVYDDTVQAVISGIVANPKQNSDIHFEEFISLATYLEDLNTNYAWKEWGSVSSGTQFFLKLESGIPAEQIVQGLKQIKGYEDPNMNVETEFFLQELTDLHFTNEFGSFSQRQANQSTLKGFLIVGILILLLGCFNFINIKTATGSLRAKEIGIRKTIGGSRASLSWQFLMESYLLTAIASLLALIMVPAVIHVLKDFLPDDLAARPIQHPIQFLYLLGLFLITGFLAGGYPALVLSGYRPNLALKGAKEVGNNRKLGVQLRQVLTVLQFSMAQIFIIATLIAANQIRYSLSMDMGFRKNAIVSFSTPFSFLNPDNSKAKLLTERLKTIPGVEAVSLAGNSPASSNTQSQLVKVQKGDEQTDISLEMKEADPAYIEVFEIPLLAGRNLQATDTLREFLVNESYLALIGISDPKDAIGQMVNYGGSDGQFPIVGVIKDFHTKSTRQQIKPIAFRSRLRYHSQIHIALNSTNTTNSDGWKSTITEVEKEWQAVFPEEPFEFTFFEDRIAQFYDQDQKLAKLLGWATGFTIFISCLGLLGLAIFNISQRTKEIGIRKVLGAKVSSIVVMLSRDFLKLVLIALVVASPIAWYLMHKWLENFVFHVQISWWLFLLTGGMAIGLAFLTVSLQSIRAALANPVESLRSE